MSLQVDSYNRTDVAQVTVIAPLQGHCVFAVADTAGYITLWSYRYLVSLVCLVRVTAKAQKNNNRGWD